MANKLETANSILKQTYALDSTKQQIKTRTELITELVEAKPSWLEVESAKEELGRLKKKLEDELSNDQDYNNHLEELGQLKDKLKSEKEILSDLIVGYRIETGEHQVEINSTGDAQELVIKGSLGKKAKYQTNLFVDKDK